MHHRMPDAVYFNSQPHKEADVFSFFDVFKTYNFNSQPHKEADRLILPAVSFPRTFQLTASQGG